MMHQHPLAWQVRQLAELLHVALSNLACRSANLMKTCGIAADDGLGMAAHHALTV